MSKSKGNTINPDDIVKRYGADTLRLYEMFMGPFDQAIPWSEEAIIGPRRFLEKVWKIAETLKNSSGLTLPRVRGGSYTAANSSVSLLHKTIKKVSEDIEVMKFNTAISALMIFINDAKSISKNEFEVFLKLLSPFAPYITEELWQSLGNKKSIQLESWPLYDISKVDIGEVIYVVQINGKVRSQFRALRNITEEDAFYIATRLQEMEKWLKGKEIKKRFFVPGKLINIVV